MLWGRAKNDPRPGTWAKVTGADARKKNFSALSLTCGRELVDFPIMPRHARSARGGVIYHVLNRATPGTRLFSKPGDYQAFEAVLDEAYRRVPIRILAYCVMPNHWHLVLWPKTGRQLSEFMRWLTVTHTQRWHWQHRTAGTGHLYQSRYRSFPVQPGEPLLTVCRYVESNPLRAKLVKRAQDWRWSSLYRRRSGTAQQQEILADLRRPANWLALVSKPLPEPVLTAARTSVQRSRPFGTDKWMKDTVKSMHLEWTVRPRGRPRKTPLPPPKKRK